MISFQNSGIVPESLPQEAHSTYQSVEPNYTKFAIISSLIFWLIILLVISSIGIGVYLEENVQLYYFTPIIVLYLGLSTFQLYNKYKSIQFMGYALRQHDILFKKGWLWKNFIAIPFNRIQHCEVNQGPIGRFFGISKLSIYTAGGSSSDLTIPGLNLDLAHDIKAFIINKTNIKSTEEE